MKVVSKPQVPLTIERVNYNAYRKKGKQTQLIGAWQEARLYPAYLHVASTQPVDGEKVVGPDTTIRLTFDRPIKPGPGFRQVTLMSAHENAVFSGVVQDDSIIIAPEVSLLDPNPQDVGEVRWTVSIPQDAFTDLQGNPLEKDLAWSFIAVP